MVLSLIARFRTVAYLLLSLFGELSAKFKHFLAKYEKPEKIYPRDADDWTM